MTQARDDFAAKLSGREYGSEMTKAEEAEAKVARLLVVFGASDGLTEFRGIVYDEADAYDGAQHGVLQSGGRWILFEGDANSRKPVKTNGVIINAKWDPPELPGASWLIKPSVPHATFDIMEDGELYCRGAVIDEEDLLPSQRVIFSERGNVEPSVFVAKFSAPLTDADIASLHKYLKGWSP